MEVSSHLEWVERDVTVCGHPGQLGGSASEFVRCYSRWDELLSQSRYWVSISLWSPHRILKAFSSHSLRLDKDTQSRKPGHPWQRTWGTCDKERPSVCGLCVKAAQYSNTQYLKHACTRNWALSVQHWGKSNCKSYSIKKNKRQCSWTEWVLLKWREQHFSPFAATVQLRSVCGRLQATSLIYMQMRGLMSAKHPGLFGF